MTCCAAAANIYAFLWSYINAGIYGTAHGMKLGGVPDHVIIKPLAPPDSKASLCDNLGVRMCW